MPAHKPKRSPKRRVASQAQEAIEAEHMFVADHDEAAFEKRLKKIAKEKRPAQKRKGKR
jgi:hypothetical protein